MANDINLTSISKRMTAKERAKLTTSLVLKGLETVDPDKDKKLPTEVDIARITNACPPEQAREYNFYIGIRQSIYRVILTSIELELSYLEALDGRANQIRHALSITPIVNEVLRMVRQQPVLVSKEDYDKAVVEAIKKESNSILELTGSHYATISKGEAIQIAGKAIATGQISRATSLENKTGIVEREAYNRLVHEGKIDQERIPDYIDGWIDFINDYNKTDEEIIATKVEEEKDGLKRYLRSKKTTENAPEGRLHKLWESYAKYEGLTDKEIGELIIKEKEEQDKKNNTNWLLRPTKEEYSLWQTTLKEEKERIDKAISEGKLTLTKGKQRRYNRETKEWEKVEVEGITAGSYYNWKDKRPEKSDYNPLKEEYIEFRYIEGKGVVNINDPDLTEEEQERGEAIAITIPNDRFMHDKLIKSNRNMIIEALESLLPVQVVEKRHERLKKLDTEEPLHLRITEKELLEAMQTFIGKVHDTIKKINGYIAVIEAIEYKYFDGMQIVSRDPKNASGAIGRAIVGIEEVVNSHNKELENIEKVFSSFDWGNFEYVLEDKEKLLLNAKVPVDIDWVNKQVKELEEKEKET